MLIELVEGDSGRVLAVQTRKASVHIYDRSGNIGPTVWCGGEIIGSWTTAPNGEIITEVIADRGAEARAAIDVAATKLHERLGGTVVTPAVYTRLERALAAQPFGH